MNEKRTGFAEKCIRGLCRILTTVLFVLGVTVFMVCSWAKNTFNVSLNAIINTLLSPLKGTSSDTVIPAIKYCLPMVVLALVLSILFVVWDSRRGSRKSTGIALGVSVLTLVLALGYVQSSYDILGYIENKSQETGFYKEYYIFPKDVVIHEPEEKRNLLYIYLESMETTYADTASGGRQEVNYMPLSMALAEENISFSTNEGFGGLRAVNGATWTMGSLFTSSSALPFAIPVGTNDMEGESLFASGVYTLGEYLEEQGYVQEFLCGSDAVFAGRRTFFEQHGNYDIFDIYTAREKGYIPEDYFVFWGFEDHILYDIAKDELLRLDALEQPFNLTMLTVDAHHIGGYVCELCGDEYEDMTANVISCADKQLAEFIAWCKEQDFYENTTIVLVGDHPRMDTHLVEGVEGEERTLYNCFINVACEEPVQEKNREASMLDMFPTVLTAMGYEIEGNKLGMGVNLFSEEQTLIEQFGFDVINEEFIKRSVYYVEQFAPELAYLVSDEASSICTVYFSGENYNATDYVLEGLSEPEDTFSWVEGKTMTVQIPIEEDVDEVRITIHVAGSMRNEYCGILKNGEVLWDGHIQKAGVIVCDIPVENGICEFEFKIPEAAAPCTYSVSEETREISLKLTHMTVQLCD